MEYFSARYFLNIWDTSLKMDSQVYFKNTFKAKFYSSLPLNEEKFHGESFSIFYWNYNI